ncbi:solute carrier family 2, facilitated glucose transporter member 8-like [Acropora muricata]|uniref:solute carrier family 2, facilitated glucose transporter member 8-like n=1 Tax=Acropora muricata TaxID=159855 RepID=UPI0034E4DF0E
MNTSELDDEFSQSQTIQDERLSDRNERVRMSVLSTFIAALGPLSFGYCLVYSSSAVVDLEASKTPSLHLTNGQASWFSSLVNVGAMFGSIHGGLAIDYLGRKGTIMVCALPFELGWLLIAFAQNRTMLYSGRVITGVACGMVSLAVPVYIAEVVPARLRGMLGSVNQLAVTLGLVLSYTTGAYVPWRWLALVGAIPPALLALLMFFMAETPRRSFGKNRRSEALAALRWLRGLDADIEREASTIEQTLDRNESLRWRDWRSSVILQPLLISIGLMVIQQFCGVNAVLFNAASIFKDAGFDNGKVVSISVGLIQFVGTALACLLMDRAGRRILLWTMALGMCITLAGLGFYFEIYIPPNGTDSTRASDTVSLLGSIHNSVEASKISWLSILCLVLFNLAFALAWGPIPWLVMSEIFPLKARGPASSLATLSNWLLAFVVTKTYSSLALKLTIQGTFWFYSGCSLLGFVFVFFVMPETKGKTLEEIEAMFNKGGHAYQPID